MAAIWDEIPVDSSTAVVERIAARHRELGCDSLVALGGGSVIDTAKAVNILASMGDAAAGLRRRRLPDPRYNRWRWCPPRRAPARK